MSSIVANATGKEYLWQADPAFWKRHSPVLFPIVGSVWKAEYRNEGTVYPLSQHGFARDMDFTLIDEAENGRLAVEKFSTSASGKYDCILMDIQMPVMDGYQAAEAIRSLKRKDAKTVPILALTANAFASDIGKAHSAGMNDHVAKPIEVDRLMETLQKWIG